MEQITYEQLTAGIIISINNRNYYVVYITDEYIKKHNLKFRANLEIGFYGLSDYIDGDINSIYSYRNMLSLNTEYSKSTPMYIVSKSFNSNLINQ